MTDSRLTITLEKPVSGRLHAAPIGDWTDTRAVCLHTEAANVDDEDRPTYRKIPLYVSAVFEIGPDGSYQARRTPRDPYGFHSLTVKRADRIYPDDVSPTCRAAVNAAIRDALEPLTKPEAGGIFADARREWLREQIDRTDTDLEKVAAEGARLEAHRAELAAELAELETGADGVCLACGADRLLTGTCPCLEEPRPE